jgi:hypothetical protein
MLLAEQQTVIDRNNRANKFIQMMMFFLLIKKARA